MPLFKPDEYLTRITKIDFDELADSGIKALLLDMDNTILPRDTGVFPQDVLDWVEEAKRRGFTLMLVSNNWHDTVYAHAAELDIPVIHKALKPIPFSFAIARHRLGFGRRECVAVGDQVLTDVLGAHLSGMKAILVVPMVEQDITITTFLRKLESGVLKNMRPSR